MSFRAISTVFALCCATSASALAAATAEEAARVKTALQNYVGAEPGVVEVATDGEDYVITFDSAPLIAKFQQDGFTGKFDPLVFKARPAGDGTWALSTSSPYNMSYGVSGAFTAEIKAASMQWLATFDEALGGITNQTYSSTGVTVKQKFSDPATLTTTSVDYAIADMKGSSTAVKVGEGSVDMSSTMTLSGITTTTTSPPAMNYTAKLDTIAVDSTIKAFRMRAVMDLLAWFVAHPNKEAIIADQAQLKEKIAAALPLWDNLDGSYEGNNVVVNTAMGDFSMATAGFEASMNGMVKQGLLREGFAFTGLKIPAGLAPPWSADLVPTDVEFDFALDGFDLETPAQKILAEIDLSKEPPLPAASEAQLLPVFLPSNSVGITIHPSEINAPAYDISYEGKFDASLAGIPTGQITITMDGMEEVLEKVQSAAATDPMAQQAMGGLVAAKGFGKADADGKLVWVIDLAANNKVSINGLDISAMLGMAPPAP